MWTVTQGFVRSMMVSAFVLAIPVIGCTTGQRGDRGEEQLLRQIPIEQPASDALRSALRAIAARDVLVTIGNDRQYKTTEIGIRYVADGAVHCDSVTIDISGVHSREAYRFAFGGAVAVFHNLHRQVAAGHKYRAVDWEPDWGGFYALALGSVQGVTTSEGGSCSLAFRQAEHWASVLAAGEEILDGDLADAYLDEDVMPSCASYIAHAIGCFDMICEVGAQHERGNEERKPDSTRH